MKPAEVIQILQQERMRPLKQLGQNFLVDSNLCELILDALEAPASADIVEIGPGLGSLTRRALARGWRVKAVEIDRGVCSYLRKALGDDEAFELIEGDALELLRDVYGGELILGNLPYHISTPLIIEMAMLEPLPRRVVMTLQRETSLRLAAEPGSKDYGATSIVVQTQFGVETLRTLKPGVFFPVPKVDSALTRLTALDSPLLGHGELRDFSRVLKKAFSQRRKKIKSSLGWEVDARPEELGVPEWVDLFKSRGSLEE